MTISLRHYQRASIDATYDYWEQGGGNGLIVLPTAAGKSLTIGTLAREVMTAFPDLRVGVVTHVKELIEQNAQELIRVWPQAPVGIYSASVGRRDTQARILFMGIQSVHDKVDVLGDFDLIIVDEAHLIPRNADTMYGKFFKRLRDRVPDMRIIGFTATPFRLDSGRLDRGDGRIFDDIIYEAEVGTLIEQGFLSKLTSERGTQQIDLSGVRVRKGDFVEEDMARAAESIVESAVAEIVELGKDRRGWLVFACNVGHAEKVRDAIRRHGICCEMVTGETPKGERSRIINAYKRREIRCLVSVGVLTTGFNAPHVDLVALLRSTLSTVLYIQMVGRAFRLCEGKENGLILDYGGNVRRHGPVDKPTPKRAGGGNKKDDEDGLEKVKRDDIRARECPQCRNIEALHVFTCTNCGHEWPVPDARHEAVAENVAILSTQKVAPQWLPVSEATFATHVKTGSPDSVLARFLSGVTVYKSWLCFGHRGRARQSAVSYWVGAGGEMPAPQSAQAALNVLDGLTRVEAICVKHEGKYPQIVGYRFEGRDAPVWVPQ